MGITVWLVVINLSPELADSPPLNSTFFGGWDNIAKRLLDYIEDRAFCPSLLKLSRIGVGGYRGVELIARWRDESRF